jgi:chromosome segregation protein
MIEEMESSYEGYNNAVKFIMKANLSGINGVVAELIEVPRGFETAIETALGPAMQISSVRTTGAPRPPSAH